MQNIRMIGYILGRIFLVEAAAMVLPLIVTIVNAESDWLWFLLPILFLVLIGILLSRKMPENRSFYARDGLAVTAFAWLAISAVGALPLFLSGAVPSYIDCFFETVSGFTTTGASILTDVEALGKGLLFWRSLTHWLGGMGILVFVIAILPSSSDGNGMHIMRAEVPGPSVGKLVSKMSTGAKILYTIYAGMTVLEIILLLCGGMSFFDACINSFGSAGTGGFSNYAASIGHYNNLYFEIVIGVFMLLFGVNFNLYYFILIGKAKDALRSEELRIYGGIIAVSVLAIALNIMKMAGGFFPALRQSFFQVSSILTTTGYATADFNLWPSFAKTLLVLLMFIGGCAGSTGGGLKVARVAILFKSAAREMKRILHPNAVISTHFEGKPLDDKMLRSSHIYFAIYTAILAGATVLISFNGYDFTTNFTAVVSCLNNIGPGLELVGPMGNFAIFSPLCTLLLSFVMLIGRLEIFPILLLLSPSMWSKNRLKK